MDIPENEPQQQMPQRHTMQSTGYTLGADLKKLFDFTGGSLLYCLSAVFVAYGIVKVIGPILSEGKSLMDALPCIVTLHAYELALLGAMILIVFKKVVDDAVSLAILIALFLIGTSIALGSVADKGITVSVFLGIIGIVLAMGKFCALWRFAQIPFGALSLTGLVALVIYNYLAPVSIAQSIAAAPTQESTHRWFWLLLSLIMLIGAALVVLASLRENQNQQTQNDKKPFLQRPAMVYTFSLILVAASGMHQYAMSYTFAIERALCDFVPVIAAAVVLLLEVMRHSGKKFGAMEIVLSCVPLGVTMLAIQQKSVLASGQFGLGLLGYPSALLAAFGFVVLVLAIYHGWRQFWVVAFVYVLGIILTAGFSPEHPYDLNVRSCFGTIVAALLLYGIVVWNQNFCFIAVAILCFGLNLSNNFSEAAKGCHLTQAGALAGVCGLSLALLYLLFGREMNKVIRVFGILCLAGFVLDYLPDSIHWRYLTVLIGTGLIVSGLWFCAKDIFLASILFVPIFIKLYIVAKQLAYWRFVILGFLLLCAGTAMSLLKRPRNDLADKG